MIPDPRRRPAGRTPLAHPMRCLLPALVLGCSTSPPVAAADAHWHAVLVNGGGSVEVNYASHRDHLVRLTDALVARGVSLDALTVLASDGADPTPDLVEVAAVPDPGTIPAWVVGPGPLFDPGAPLAALWPAEVRVDTAWTATPVAPATAVELGAALSAVPLAPGDTLLLYTTDHGEPDGSLSLWNESLAPTELAAFLRHLQPEARVVVAMSQCHSGAFAGPLLDLRAEGVDVCGFFSVPADRQATGCFPERDGAPVGHGFRFADAIARSAHLGEVHDHLVREDRGPDVPLRTSDVWLWEALSQEADRRGEDVVQTVDRILAEPDAGHDPEARAQLAALAARLGMPPPTRLSEVVAAADRWLPALDAGALRVEDLAWVRHDATLRVQATALEAPVPPDVDWADRLHRAADREGLTDPLPALVAAQARAEAELWTWTVQEALLARMSWLLARVAGRALVGDDPRLSALVACETARLPGSPRTATPPEPWSVAGPVPQVPALPWVGVRLDTSPTGAPRVVAVHPDGPAADVLAEGMTVESIDGTATPSVESVVSRWALAVPGSPLHLQTDRGPRDVTPVPWPEVLAPLQVPDAGAPAPAALAWLSAAPAGPHLVAWVSSGCDLCGPAVERARAWAQATGHALVVVDDGAVSGTPGAVPDLGGWTADAFAVDLLPTVVAVDATGRVAWRVDGWAPEEGVDLPPLPGETLDHDRFPRAPPQTAHTARGTPGP